MVAADIVYATLSLDRRPTEQVPGERGLPAPAVQAAKRRDYVGRREIPRLKIRPAHPLDLLRVVGEYDTSLEDDLRDDTRTELPIVIKDSAGVDRRALGFETSRLAGGLALLLPAEPGTRLRRLRQAPTKSRSATLRRVRARRTVSS